MAVKGMGGIKTTAARHLPTSATPVTPRQDAPIPTPPSGAYGNGGIHQNAWRDPGLAGAPVLLRRSLRLRLQSPRNRWPCIGY
jgi:hypothetical protein